MKTVKEEVEGCACVKKYSALFMYFSHVYKILELI